MGLGIDLSNVYFILSLYNPVLTTSQPQLNIVPNTPAKYPPIVLVRAPSPLYGLT